MSEHQHYLEYRGKKFWVGGIWVSQYECRKCGEVFRRGGKCQSRR